MIALRLHDISVEVGPAGPLILDHIDLTLESGTLTVLRGRSGSGKTTLLNTVLGWAAPIAGHIDLPGGATPLDATSWRTVTVAPQTAALLPELTVGENIDAARHLGGLPARWPIDDLLARLDLSALADRPADQISLGEQQRCSIARALAPLPGLLLADEPLASQDAEHAAAVVATLVEACGRGVTCLVASHDALLLPPADQIITVHDGMLAPGHQP